MNQKLKFDCNYFLRLFCQVICCWTWREFIHKNKFRLLDHFFRARNQSTRVQKYVCQNRNQSEAWAYFNCFEFVGVVLFPLEFLLTKGQLFRKCGHKWISVKRITKMVKCFIDAIWTWHIYWMLVAHYKYSNVLTCVHRLISQNFFLLAG